MNISTIKNGKLLFLFSLILLLASCNGIPEFLRSGYDLTDSEEVLKAKEKIAEVLPKEAKIVNITFSSSNSNTFSNSLGVIQVILYEKDSEELKRYDIRVSDGSAIKDMSIFLTVIDREKYTPEIGYTLEDFDFSKISEYLNKGGEILKSEDYPFSGIESYKLIVNKDTKKIEQSFVLQSKIGTSKKYKHGKMVSETSYYDISFSVDDNGNVVVLKK